MPKKPPRNSFYFYMLDFKEEQRKKGIHLGNMREVAEAAGPAWQQVSPAVRAKYDAMAKAEKLKTNAQEKYTSTGVPLSMLAQEDADKRDAEEFERRDIKEMIMRRHVDGTLLHTDLYVMDVNYYCHTTTGYLVGESSILRFNVAEGVRDFYHELINPGEIPLGYALEVKLGSEDLGLEMPDSSKPGPDYMSMLARIIDYLKHKDSSVKTLPPVFALPDKVAPVTDFINSLCRRAGEDDGLFRVYKLDFMFFTLLNSLSTRGEDSFPKESLALAELNKDSFRYSPGLGCKMHLEGEKSEECTLARAHRWAYSVLDYCCTRASITAVVGKHVPAGYHVPSISSYRDGHRERARPAPRVASFGDTSFSSAASFDTVFESATAATPAASAVSAASTTADSGKSAPRTHQPLRMPRLDYSQEWRAPPQLSDDAEFPRLMGRGRGASAGRLLSAGLSNVRLDK